MPMKMVRDKKTGRKRRVDPTKSRKASVAARSRKGRPMKANVKLKISRAVRRTVKTGKTKAGRRVVKM